MLLYTILGLAIFLISLQFYYLTPIAITPVFPAILLMILGGLLIVIPFLISVKKTSQTKDSKDK